MRIPLSILCLPLLAACDGTTPMGTDAAAMDSATPLDAARMIDSSMAVDASMGIDAPTMGCTYPEGAVEPMAMGEVLWPYRWPEAISGDGATNVPLDLVDAHCTADANIDWSPFDVLVFIAIPGW